MLRPSLQRALARFWCRRLRPRLHRRRRKFRCHQLPLLQRLLWRPRRHRNPACAADALRRGPRCPRPCEAAVCTAASVLGGGVRLRPPPWPRAAFDTLARQPCARRPRGGGGVLPIARRGPRPKAWAAQAGWAVHKRGPRRGQSAACRTGLNFEPDHNYSTKSCGLVRNQSRSASCWCLQVFP